VFQLVLSKLKWFQTWFLDTFGGWPTHFRPISQWLHQAGSGVPEWFPVFPTLVLDEFPLCRLTTSNSNHYSRIPLPVNCHHGVCLPSFVSRPDGSSVLDDWGSKQRNRQARLWLPSPGLLYKSGRTRVQVRTRLLFWRTWLDSSNCSSCPWTPTWLAAGLVMISELNVNSALV